MKDINQKIHDWTHEHPVATTNICFGLMFIAGYRAGMRKGYKMCMDSVDYALKEIGKVWQVTKF